MKKFITLVVAFGLFVSCGTTRKLQQSTQKSRIDSTTTHEVGKAERESVVDTTRTEHGKVIITEIEFFPPTEIEQPQPPEPEKSKKKDNPKDSDPPTTASIDLSNVGKIQGAVKSIKQTVIESQVEQKGESRDTEKQEQCKSNANVLRKESNIQKKEAPAPDPYRWRYAFYISLLFVAVLLYLKHTPILNWIKKILAGIRRIL